MPYGNPKQATAAFLNIKRQKGSSAAKAFGKKHAAAMGDSNSEATAAGPRGHKVGYTSRAKRGVSD